MKLFWTPRSCCTFHISQPLQKEVGKESYKFSWLFSKCLNFTSQTTISGILAGVQQGKVISVKPVGCIFHWLHSSGVIYLTFIWNYSSIWKVASDNLLADIAVARPPLPTSGPWQGESTPGIALSVPPKSGWATDTFGAFGQQPFAAGIANHREAKYRHQWLRHYNWAQPHEASCGLLLPLPWHPHLFHHVQCSKTLHSHPTTSF